MALGPSTISCGGVLWKTRSLYRGAINRAISAKESKMPIFEIMYVELPKPVDKNESGAVEKIILGPQVYAATDRESAIALSAARLSSATEKYEPSRLKVLVRPFV